MASPAFDLWTTVREMHVMTEELEIANRIILSNEECCSKWKSFAAQMKIPDSDLKLMERDGKNLHNKKKKLREIILRWLIKERGHATVKKLTDILERLKFTDIASIVHKSVQECQAAKQPRRHKCPNLKKGLFKLRVKPDGKVTHLVDLSQTVQLEIPPDAVSEEMDLTAILGEDELYPISNDEYLMSDVFIFGPDGSIFQRPIFIKFKVKDVDESKSKLRKMVVRTKNVENEWTDLYTCNKDGETVVAEIEHFSPIVLVSKPEEMQFITKDTDVLSIECSHDGLNIHAAQSPESAGTSIMTVTCHYVERGTLLQAVALESEYEGTFIGLGPIMKINRGFGDQRSTNRCAITLSLPNFEEANGLPVDNLIRSRNIKLLRDKDDDKWINVTKNLGPEESEDRSMKFEENVQCRMNIVRYCLAIADIQLGMAIPRVMEKATTMARKRQKLVNFILLQNARDCGSLYIECVVKNKVDSRLEQLETKKGFVNFGTYPNSGDVEMVDGEKVKLRVRGKYVTYDPEETESELTFNKCKDSHVELQVDVDRNAVEQDGGGVGCIVGYVDFLRMDDDGSRCAQLKFKLVMRPSETTAAAPPTNDTPTSGNAGRGGKRVDVAIGVLCRSLLKTEWRPLARKLGLTKVDIDDIEVRFPDDPRERVVMMFEKWKQKNSRNATVEALHVALTGLEKYNYLESIYQELRIPYKNPSLWKY